MRALTNFGDGCREATDLQKKGQLPAAEEACSETKERLVEKEQVLSDALIKNMI